MPTLNDVKTQIKSLDGASKFLGRREIKELPKILWEDEKVESIVQGKYNNNLGILIATNKRLVFVDKKLIGVRVEDFPYDKLTSIQYETGLVYGKISIFTSGNRANIEKVSPKNQVRDFAEYIRARITSKHEQPESNKGSQNDGMSQIEKLAELKEKGILTKAEFEAKKKQILGIK
jgi:hypothetical protein